VSKPLPAHSDPIQVILRPLNLALHEVQIEMQLPASAVKSGVTAQLPVWTPGSYLVRDYARFLDRVRLTDAQGRAHPIAKIGKQRWSIPPSEGPLKLSYRLFCNDLTVRTNHVDTQQAHLVSAASFLGLEGQPDRPIELRFEGWPADWEVASSLPQLNGAFRAKDFDTLVDSPFALGPLRNYTWSEQGTEFELAILGRHNGNEARILEGTKRIVATCGQLFGGFPFPRYVFLLLFSPGTAGGLEHRDSTSLLADSFLFAKPEGYAELFTLIAHEFFHAWNVKRLRAEELGPFDYSKENETAMLWFHEGFTSFMQFGLVLRAGVATWPWVARKLSGIWTDYTSRAGRLEQSLEEASFDAWIRHYKPTEFSLNSTVSYYDKGAAVAWMMDAKLRLASGGERGLDHFFQLLWQRTGDRPLKDADLRKLYQELSGEDPRPFWEAYIQGRAELDARDIARAYGLRFQASAPWEEGPDSLHPVSQERARIYTGLTLSREGTQIQNIHPDSPAARAGLAYGQEILAVDGWRTAKADEVQQRFADGAVGIPVEVLAADRGRVFACTVIPEEHPLRCTWIKPAVAPSPAQRAAFQAWTGQSLPLPSKGRP